MKNISKASVSTFLLLMMVSQSVHAKEDKDFVGLEGFVDGCTELVQIYKNRSQQRFLAGQTTSLSEALRAGYCRGVIDQYKQQNTSYRSGCFTGWYEIAEFVARQKGVEQRFGDMDNLLKTACHGG